MRLKNLAASSLVLAASVVLLLSPLRAEDSAVQMHIQKASLLDVSTGKLVIGVTADVTSKRDATVQQVVFTGMRLNGLPFYVAPYKQKLELHAGQKLDLPDPLRITIYLRDLDTVAPLQQAISDGKGTIDGGGYVTVHLGFLGKLAMFQNHADTPIAIHEEVPFEIPGGSLVKAAALKVLVGADALLHGATNSVSASQMWASKFRKDLGPEYAGRVLFAYAHYDVRDADGKVTTMEWNGVALRCSQGKLIISKEALEPWKFDADIAAGLQNNELWVVDNSYDLAVWPSSAQIASANGLNLDSALLLSKKQIKVAKKPDDANTTVVTLNSKGKTYQVNVIPRGVPSDIVSLTIQQPDALDGSLKISNPQADKWETVAVFRFRKSRSGGSDQPDIIMLPASRVHDRIQLAEEVDQSAFGSPIIATDGVIGIVQDENGGIAWQKAAKELKLSQAEGGQK